ncbi:MAG: hypothetical protein JO157_13130 [Acetobacteraceae bacterium]|nr:hypothetical protein [Acetobacteraceae bacterium]
MSEDRHEGVDLERGVSSGAKSRWLMWPLFVAAGFPALVVVLNASPLGPNFLYVMLVMPMILLTWVMVGIGSAVMAVVALGRKAWLQAMSLAVLPLIISVVAVKPFEFIRHMNYTGDVIHFAVMRPFYLSAVETLPPSAEPKLLVFDRGGMIWASRGYVYDESDEILLPKGTQSAAWKERASHTEVGCGYVASPLWGHFYLADFPC